MRLRPFGAALLLVAAVAGGGWAVTLANRHTASTGPSHARPGPTADVAAATAAPTPVPTPPPPGIDLLWREAGPDVERLDALDWTGQVRGALALPASTYHLGGVSPSADGQRLLLEQDGDYTVLSAQGVAVAHFPGDSGNLLPAWADDEVHLCAVERTGDTSADVLLVTLGGSNRRLTSLHWPLGDGGPNIVVCNVRSDLLVVQVSLGDDAAGHVEEIETVRISTGAVLHDLHPPGMVTCGRDVCGLPGTLSTVTGSPEGHLLAVAPHVDVVATTTRTAIVDTLSGRTLGHVDGFVHAFSDDGAAVYTDSGVIDWRTGRATHPTPACCGDVVATHGGDMVIALPGGPPPTRDASGVTGTYPPPILVLLRADGTQVQLGCCGAAA